MGLCDECFGFKAFGKKCWFYWELKKRCTQFRQSPDDEPKFKESL